MAFNAPWLSMSNVLKAKRVHKRCNVLLKVLKLHVVEPDQYCVARRPP